MTTAEGQDVADLTRADLAGAGLGAGDLTKGDLGRGRRALVVEDEWHISEMLATTLRFAGFETAVAFNGSDALDAVRRDQPDLVLLDVLLPDLDGFEVCRRLRAEGNEVPVLFLTARDSLADRLAGLSLGGDDYIAKPFAVSEVIARAGAVLRRSAAKAAGPEPLRAGDLEMDDEAHLVRKAGVDVELSPTEYRLLRYLLRNEGRVLSKAQILDQIWQYDFGGDASVVEKFVSRLRQKVCPEQPVLIETVRGFGYRLRAPAK
ncbi:MAG: response regulator transcription factor [Acidimicrobiales bacterium]